jgi:hypothetical protein
MAGIVHVDSTNMDSMSGLRMDTMSEFEPPRFSDPFPLGEAERPINNFRLSLDRGDNHD